MSRAITADRYLKKSFNDVSPEMIVNFVLALLHHKWRQVEKNAYYIFQVLKTTSEVRPPVLLKFVMRRPTKKIRMMSRTDSS